MHILVIGGTGQCGQIFIPQALQAGHQLTLYARSPSKFTKDIVENPNINVVKGDFSDENAMKEALGKGAEILISFAGPDFPAKSTAITEFYDRLFPLLESHSSIRRCLILSTASYKAPEDRGSFKWWFGISVIKTVGGTVYQEINGLSRATASLPSDKIEWTIFRVPRLSNGDAKPVRAGFIGDGTDGMFVSRKSIAAWLLQELEERKWIGKAPNLSNQSLF